MLGRWDLEAVVSTFQPLAAAVFSYDLGTLWNLSFPSKALTDRTLQKWVKWMHGILTIDNFSIGEHEMNLYVFYLGYRMGKIEPTSGHVGALGSWGGGFHHPTIGSGRFFSYDVGTLWNLSFPSKALTDRTLQKWVKWMHGFVTIDDPSIGEPFYLYIYICFI